MKLVIVISGMPGSGKSTVARYIAQAFNLRHVSAGNAVRKLAVKMGYEILTEFHNHMRANPSIDKEIDKAIQEEASKGGVVIDGWLAGYTVKKADFKIFLKTPEEESAKRIAGREGITYNQALLDVKNRLKYNRERWRFIYGIDVNDLKPYNLILDTSKWTIKEMNMIIKFIINKLIKGGAKR